jgi:hypothetical protein
MHQHQLLTFASKFNAFPQKLSSPDNSYTAPGYPADEYSFLPPGPSQRLLSNSEFKHLQQHYRTVESIATLQDPELIEMDRNIEVWYRCRKDKTIFHCAQNRKKNSTRLNHLACFQQTVDRNARFGYNSRPEQMEFEDFYAFIQFYCIHTFREKPHMLVYAQYHKVNIHDGLVEDAGSHVYGFADVTVISHLCARVSGHGKKIYFVDAPEFMEKRLRKALRGPN